MSGLTGGVSCVTYNKPRARAALAQRVSLRHRSSRCSEVKVTVRLEGRFVVSSAR